MLGLSTNSVFAGDADSKESVLMTAAGDRHDPGMIVVGQHGYP
jgi:hypothetical protein